MTDVRPYPDADTIPGFDYSGWMGFFLPKGTPKAINDKVRAAVVKAMEAPLVKKGMAIQATEIVILGPAEFRKVVQESMVQNEKLVNAFLGALSCRSLSPAPSQSFFA